MRRTRNPDPGLASRYLRATTARVALVILFILMIPIPSAFAADNNSSTSGLYDDAEVLTPDERESIEERIRDVEQAGAPAVVYLRLLHTDDDQAVEDAQRLMESWEIESSPGAYDGVVMFFNLEPDDPNRGEFGIVAGEAHYDDGALPQSELNRIRNQMTDLLAEDQLADAIILGLELTAERLEAGPREPTAFESFLDRIASGPVSLVNVASILLAGVLGLIGWRTWQDRPRAPHLHKQVTTKPPEDLHPALAGGLTQGSVDHSQVEATILELGRRGAIAFEPDSDDSEKVQIRLIDETLVQTPYESSLMSILEQEAEGGVLNQDAISKTQLRWSQVQESITAELEKNGWFDPQFSSRRLPLIPAGVLAIVLGIAAFIPAPIIEDPWVLVGAGTLAMVGVVTLSMASTFPRTTFEGERRAVPWRGYRDGLKKSTRAEYGEIDLDEAFPYIVAMSLTSDFHDHLEKASKAGYVPAWLTRTEDADYIASNWFIYWVAFHGVVSPQSTGGTGSMPGGAATGSGGAGGRF